MGGEGGEDTVWVWVGGVGQEQDAVCRREPKGTFKGREKG